MNQFLPLISLGLSNRAINALAASYKVNNISQLSKLWERIKNDNSPAKTLMVECKNIGEKTANEIMEKCQTFEANGAFDFDKGYQSNVSSPIRRNADLKNIRNDIAIQSLRCLLSSGNIINGIADMGFEGISQFSEAVVKTSFSIAEKMTCKMQEDFANGK